MASRAAAMPPEVARNLRRLIPSFLEAESASSLIRSSTCFCCLVCGFGRYSPLDTFRVGIGERQSSGSTSYARVHLANSSGVIHVWSGSLLPVRSRSDISHPPQTNEMKPQTGCPHEDLSPCLT